MTSAQPAPDRLDRPFPGARPQVPGTHALDADAPTGERRLPLEAARTAAGVRWSVRLPVRAETISVTKEVVVYERATVRRREQDDVARVEESVRRERLTVATDGHANVVEDSADERPTRGNGED